jgi:DNA-binding response OmpR family regulator
MTREWRVALTAQELAVVKLALVDLWTEEGKPKLGHVQARYLQSALGKITGATRAREPNDDAARPPRSEDRPVMLDEPSLAITIRGQRFVCKPTSFRLLSFLVHQRGQWVRAEALARDVLGVCFQKGASNLRWHALQARRALGAQSALLHGDNRLGYMFDLSPCSRRHCSVR